MVFYIGTHPAAHIRRYVLSHLQGSRVGEEKMGVHQRIPSRPGTSTESTGVQTGMQGQPRIHHRERDERPGDYHRMYDTR